VGQCGKIVSRELWELLSTGRHCGKVDPYGGVMKKTFSEKSNEPDEGVPSDLYFNVDKKHHF